MPDSRAIEPTGRISDAIDTVFKEDGGLLAREFAGYKERPGQVKLARQIAHSIEHGRHVIGEGPTGTGKSLAYSVPAIYATKPNEDERADGLKKHVVIVTANIALQEQLVNKDLPLLKKILPVDFDFALLKGIGNYLCRDAFEIENMKTGMFAGEDWEEVRRWAMTTQTGDRSELDFDAGKVWLKVSSSAEDCKRDKCPHEEKCFGRNAQMVARTSNVIVTNYHFLFAHYKILQISGGAVSLLPPHCVLVLDEVHKAAEIARDFFGENVSFFSVIKAAKKCVSKETARNTGPAFQGVHDSEYTKVERAAEAFYDRLTKFMRGRAYQNRLRIQNSVEWESFCDVLRAYRAQVLKATKGLRERAGPLLEENFKELGDHEKDLVRRHTEVEKARERLREIDQFVQDSMTLEHADQNVYYLDEDSRRNRAVLKSKLIHPGPLLNTIMWNQTPSVIATSATLSTAGNFKWISEELGAPKNETDTIQVESPFNHKNALLIVPDGKFIPDPKSEQFSHALPGAVERILNMSDGRALCLFTSYSNMKTVADYLQRRPLPWEVLVQGQAPRTKLVERFKKNTKSVLLGVESFWAGVDVPGESLSCVIIDRLPFPTPADPVLDALGDIADVNVFFDHMVPRAQVQLKQGVGRGIRSITDRAVIAILDRRIIEKRYGAGFVSSLPPMLKTRNINAVGEFLG